ncbi:serine hydrolase [Flavobacteriaceae bacterium Ap0902]|nr:serine hydrolase [Flavobacteriaceae bacterium Ap0902]
MKYLFYLLLLTAPQLNWGQTELKNNEGVTKSFIKYYNEDDYQAIFDDFNKEMQAALPLSKASNFLQNLKKQVGNIVDYNFIQYKNGYASYKTNFAQMTLTLNVAVDEESKISGLYIQPFEDQDANADVLNKLDSEKLGIDEELSNLIFENIKSFPSQTQASIAIIQNGKPLYLNIQKLNDSIIQNQDYLGVYEIGSISKIFTSTLLAHEVNQNKLNLNDPIHKILDIDLKDNINISLKSLSNHSSGLPRLPINLELDKANPANPYKDYNEEKLIRYLKDSLSLHNAGTYQYSNLGAGLLGYILSKNEHDSYENILQRYIFEPLNMTHTTTNRGQIENELIIGLNADGDPTPPWDFNILAGAGAIYSNIEDLTKFALAHMDKDQEDLNLTRAETMMVDEGMSLGLGWHILKSPSNNNWYWHNGATGGYTSIFVMDVNTRNGVIILSNVSAFNSDMGKIDLLGFKLMEKIDLH